MKPYALLITAAAGLVLCGCNPKPLQSREVPESALPAQARELLVEDATINRVEEQTFKNGQIVYRIHYTADGKQKAVDYNTKTELTPRGVLEPQ